MLATHRIWSLSHKKKPNHQFPGHTVPPAPHPCQGQQHCQHCCLNPQQSCRAGCASPHSPGCLPCTHIPQSPGHADPRSHCHSVGKQGGELSDKNIIFFPPGKWHVIKTETFRGRALAGATSAGDGLSRERKHHPSLACSLVMSCVCKAWFRVMSLIWVRKLYFHILPKPSTSHLGCALAIPISSLQTCLLTYSFV